jgi:hypothetical protein
MLPENNLKGKHAVKSLNVIRDGPLVENALIYPCLSQIMNDKKISRLSSLMMDGQVSRSCNAVGKLGFVKTLWSQTMTSGQQRKSSISRIKEACKMYSLKVIMVHGVNPLAANRVSGPDALAAEQARGFGPTEWPTPCPLCSVERNP